MKNTRKKAVNIVLIYDLICVTIFIVQIFKGKYEMETIKLIWNNIEILLVFIGIIATIIILLWNKYIKDRDLLFETVYKHIERHNAVIEFILQETNLVDKINERMEYIKQNKSLAGLADVKDLDKKDK